MISIIIPLYNKEAIIERTLRSVLSQDYDDFEVVIVDDGSTDGSVAIVKQFISVLPPSKGGTEWVFISQENGGPSKARNTGMKHAKGEWIVFLDADDEFLPGALTHFSQLCDEHKGIDIFCCTFLIRSGHEIRLAHTYKDGVVKNNFKSHYYGEFLARTGATMCKHTLIEKYLFDERIRRFEDLEQLFNMFREANVYLSNQSVLQFNYDYISASYGRKDIHEDFLGHIDFKGKSFWEKMCLYKFYLGERPLYPIQCNQRYKSLRWRYDLLILNKILTYLCH